MTGRRRWRRLGLGLATAALTLLLIEGLSSVAVFALRARLGFWPPVPERSHTVYDAELGWAGARSHQALDVYGPGVHVTTNADGFRGSREFEPEVPAGQHRVICLGDSFTFGHSVADTDTWPARLERTCPSIEAPNMGQSGYGLDQNYLWYLRDGVALEHGVLVLAIIALDIDRLRTSRMVLYGKPVLRIEDGELVARNVPVPRAPYRWPVLTQNLRLLWNLRSVELVQRIADELGEAPPGDPWAIDETQARDLAIAILRDLDRITRERGVKLLLVHLPHLAGSRGAELAAPPGFAAEAMRQASLDGIPFLDLAPRFRALPPPERARLFVQDSPLEGAGRHYSAAGNALVARAIAAKMIQEEMVPAAACTRLDEPRRGAVQ